MRAHSSLPRSSRQAPHSGHVVPDHGSSPAAAPAPATPTPTGSAPSGNGKSKGSSATSMLDKFKLFGTKSREVKENPPAAADDASAAPKNGHQSAVDGASVATPGDCRAPRLPVRSHRDAGASQQQAPLTDAAQLQTQSSNADALASLPPGGARSNLAGPATHHAYNSSVSTPSKISKVGVFLYAAMLAQCETLAFFTYNEESIYAHVKWQASINPRSSADVSRDRSPVGATSKGAWPRTESRSLLVSSKCCRRKETARKRHRMVNRPLGSML
jgi:hypothetical protein